MKSRRGSTLVESALALTAFVILMAGIMEVGFSLFAANSITYAAQRAARYASLAGSTSGHPAQAADIQTVAQSYAAPLSPITVNVSWLPDNNPGSSVQVQVIFAFKPAILPLDGNALSLQSTARAAVVQ